MEITWTQDLTCGDPHIDNQHKEMIKRINAIHHAIEDKLTDDEIYKIVDFLNGYIKFHLDDEEKLMKKHAYPGMIYHRMEHKKLTESVREYRKNLDEKGISTAYLAQMQAFLINWFINHIKKTDTLLASFLESVKYREKFNKNGE
ncbi:MAG: bacteriohemerythrin [Firmicutes bacterium]|nr:bacteriohemerythrin [Bacillota bacterium]